MKHRHHDIICAKVANMDLVIFAQNSVGWLQLSSEVIELNESWSYFACLPQHEKACLHWLDGGKIQVDNGNGYGKSEYTLTIDENPLSDFISHAEYCFSIKPRTEKRWITIHRDFVGYRAFRTKKEAKEHYYREACQFIEIEVEVECDLKISPRTEKRWIGVFSSNGGMANTAYSYESIEELKSKTHTPYGFDHWQFIEIEVEVK